MVKARASMSRNSTAVSKAVVKQMIRSSIASNTELKIAQNGANGSTSTAGAIAGITNIIVQDDTVGGRTGEKIIVKSLTCKFQATINVASTSDRVRCLIFADTENQNAIPLVIDVLASANVNSFPNIGYEAASRFKIFYDETFQLNTAGAAGCFKTFKVPIKNWPVYYSTNTGLGRNNLFFLEISDTATLATFAFTSEIRYTDA
jgi:hypothetical protein